MDVLHRVINKIHADPTQSSSSTLRALVKSLDTGEHFDINQLYQLNYSDFGLAVELLRHWRLDSYRYERGWAARAAVDPATSKTEIPAWVHTGSSLSGQR